MNYYNEQVTKYRSCFIRSNALGHGRLWRQEAKEEHQCTTILAIPNTRWRDHNDVGAVLNHYIIIKNRQIESQKNLKNSYTIGS